VTGKIVGLFHDPWESARVAPRTLRRPLALWKKAVWYRANPRSADYMKSLLAERFPDAGFIEVDGQSLDAAVPSDATRIVLLFPDAIGLGCAWMAGKAARRAPNASLTVLNGRRRQFELDARSRVALASRRFLERTMIVEFAAGAFILLATPFLLAFDFVRGRK
jgi:hypothetical protein